MCGGTAGTSSGSRGSGGWRWWCWWSSLNADTQAQLDRQAHPPAAAAAGGVGGGGGGTAAGEYSLEDGLFARLALPIHHTKLAAAFYGSYTIVWRCRADGNLRALLGRALASRLYHGSMCDPLRVAPPSCMAGERQQQTAHHTHHLYRSLSLPTLTGLTTLSLTIVRERSQLRRPRLRRSGHCLLRSPLLPSGRHTRAADSGRSNSSHGDASATDRAEHLQLCRPSRGRTKRFFRLAPRGLFNSPPSSPLFRSAEATTTTTTTAHAIAAAPPPPSPPPPSSSA